jgi:hypothetical protein
MTKKPAFWVALAVLSVVSTVFSWRYFTQAFPLLSLDIRMDRQAALANARTLAAERHLGPTDFRDAASFSINEEVQTFVELEGGGKPAFAALLADRLFAPYRWRVRHFKESEKHEASFTFAPDGTPDGFVERLKEDAPGAALQPVEARRIAETTAAAPWGVDFTGFQAVEQSEERRTGGRADHTFVYERSDRRLGEGRYRLRLVVSGDRLTELTYFIKTPDAFARRYEQMRSLNTAIGIGGSLGFLLIYGAGGIAFGLFVLGRQRWVLWRQPVFWGAVVGLAQTVARVNEWPLAWMQYDTALTATSFIVQQAALALAELALTVTLFSLSFMAAESLTRRAFPDHPQFWRIWGGDAASPAVLGRTAGGYLLVPIFVAYDVALYLFATKSLGWWTPSEALFNPDVLASYAPWVSAIAKSFQAGFWEESLFRAVPIAGAALIGDRLGHRRLWIVFAFVVQAVIFGAGHAPYPTQPAYARPVELIIPSIAFGLLYLQFGLLPGIVLHFAFDAFWFAMPLFATTAAGIRVQQVVIVAMILVPLWVVLTRRARSGRSVADAARNSSWRPSPPAAYEAAPARPLEPDAGLTAALVKSILAVGAVGVVVWTVETARLPLHRVPLSGTRADAIQAARASLNPAPQGDQWRFLPLASPGVTPAHRFIWTTAGTSTYDSLIGSYLPAPGWNVFVKTFKGDVAERAENWTVHLDADGTVQRVSHELPESRAGGALDDATARQRARDAIVKRFGIGEASLEEVSAVPSKLPQRTDWTVTFADRSRPLSRGQLRLSARFAGEELADVQRFVFVPEDWERNERNSQITAFVIQGAGLLFGVVMVLGGAIAAIVSWTRRQFAIRPFLVTFAAFLCLAGVRFANNFSAVMAALTTAQPLQIQLAVLIGSGVVGLTLQSAAVGLIAGSIPGTTRLSRLALPVVLAVGAALGAVAAALASGSLLGAGAPLWPSYGPASAFVPLIAAVTNPAVTTLARTTLLLLMVSIATRMTSDWTHRRALAGVLIVVLGALLGDVGSTRSPAVWAAFAVATGALLLIAYVWVFRHDARAVPAAVATAATLETIREGAAQAYPGALGGAVIAVGLIWLVAYAWMRALTPHGESRTMAVSSEGPAVAV